MVCLCPMPGLPRLTDVHVHLAALPTATNGCRLSRRMRKSPLTRFLAWTQGLPLDDPETEARARVCRADRRGRVTRRAGCTLLGTPSWSVESLRRFGPRVTAAAGR